jgi:hypothetical protein
MSTFQISCKIGSTDTTAGLGLEIWLDEQQLYNTDHVADTVSLTFDIDEDEADHELRFVMKNKTQTHTTIDEAGNIVTDATLTISDITFDKIALRQIFIDHAEYTHDFNGTQDKIIDKFYSEMGCNGIVSLKFTTPIYLWLLENM